MISSTKKKSIRKVRRIIFWIILILLGFIMLYGFYREMKNEEEFQKHKENEQTHPVE
jgi:putative Mn2+ efflux pump MntP